MSLQLTSDQQKAVDAIVTFLDEPDTDVFTLSGIAGAGKTTCIREALRGRNNILGAVVSHSAKSILEASLEGIARCLTVAQLLGLRQSIDEDGKITFIPRAHNPGELPIENCNILVVDECSMIDDNTFNQIVSLKRSKCKVIFMGDNRQLPPIDDSHNDSVTFNYIKANLDKAVRYTGPIADLGQRIRDEIDKLDEDKPASRFLLNDWMEELGHRSIRTSKIDENGSGYIFLNDIGKVVEIALNAFKSDDPEAMRMIAYRNSSVKKINSVIRAQLYADGDESAMDDIPQFMPGELVICNGGYGVKPEGARYPQNVIYNNQTFKVVSTLPTTGPHEIPSLLMKLEPEVPLPEGCGIYSLDWENGRYDYFEIHNQLKNNAKEDSRQWPIYYDFKANWAEFDYAYALTGHKSQGRTFTDTIIFERDIFSVKKAKLKAKLQALYVACTRAKRRVYIYNAKYRVNQNEVPDNVRKELGI